jgi:hypothetical protein
MTNASTIADYEFAVQRLVPNVEGVLVGKQRKPRPFLQLTTEYGSDAERALRDLEADGGANGQRRIVARKRGVDERYGNFPTGWEAIFGPRGEVSLLWKRVKAEAS